VSVSPLPPSADSSRDASRPRAALWLTGAAVLALAVQAIFLLMPEPKSAGAPDPATPEISTPLDSNAFTLEEDHTVLPTETDNSADSTAASAAAADSVPSTDAPQPKPAPKPELEEFLPPVRVDTAPVNSLPQLPESPAEE
jgi:hypothetical protein